MFETIVSMREGSSSWDVLELTKRRKACLAESKMSSNGGPMIWFASPDWPITGMAESVGAGSLGCSPHSCRIGFRDPACWPIDCADVCYTEQLAEGVVQSNNMP